MKRERKLVSLLVILVQLCLVSCIEPFNPPNIEQTDSYLVVDGFFNTSNSMSTIRLSRTFNLSKGDTLTPETNARVVVERERGGQYLFTEQVVGVYTYPPEFIGQQENFRLRITTQDGKEYLSDYTTAKIPPPIDSIGYEVVRNGEAIQINVNGQDSSGNTRFYRWEMEETWEYTAALISQYDRIINTCWKTNKPKKITVGSTIKLKDDILSNVGIATFPVSSNRFLIKYRVLVRQYALTKEAYEYWMSLEKTTESTGGIFDPFPSLVNGNIRCQTDPQESVFGFFSAGSAVEKSVTIRPGLGEYPICYPKQFTLSEKDLNARPDLMKIGAEGDMFIVADKECVDCRLQGGTLTRPPFW